MRKYIYFMSADAAHLRRRLKRLAQKGLELVGTQGLFTGEFDETKRSDLDYLVVPYGKRDNYPAKIDGSGYGWELVGGFNGMAIYKTLPCVDGDGTALLEKLRAEGCVREDRYTIPLMEGALFLAAALLFLFPVAIPELSEQWYLSWFGICLPLLRTVVVGMLVINVLTFRTYLAAWIHGLTPWVVLGAAWLTLVMSRLDDRGRTIYFIVILFALTVASVVSLWNMCRSLGVGIGLICLAVLWLGLRFPVVEQSGVNLRGLAKDEQVITLADLGDESTLIASGLEKEGTILVGKTTYWEISEERNLSCEVYQCLTSALAEEVAQGEQLRSSGDGRERILRHGKTVFVVTCDESIGPGLGDMIEAVLLP